jgi:hypothetical protein
MMQRNIKSFLGKYNSKYSINKENISTFETVLILKNSAVIPEVKMWMWVLM